MPRPSLEALALAYWRTALDLRLNLRAGRYVAAAADTTELFDLADFVGDDWPALRDACDRASALGDAALAAPCAGAA
jgi:hypothetical protein